jgi:hypothetical protein
MRKIRDHYQSMLMPGDNLGKSGSESMGSKVMKRAEFNLYSDPRL